MSIYQAVAHNSRWGPQFYKGCICGDPTILKRARQQNFEFVGDQFAYEARKIHYSKSNKKPVYGNATKEEVTDLSDEGIEVTSIPWIKEDN